MHLAISAFILTWAAFAAAQAGLGDLPDCAKNCATNALPQNCQLVDIKCICSTTSFITSISCCVATACSSADQQKTLQIADQLCGAAGVSLPSAAGCSSGASAASATGSVAATSASGSMSMSKSASGMSAGASSMASSVAASATSTGASSKTSGATAAGASSSGGAMQHMASNIGAVGAAVAAIALL